MRGSAYTKLDLDEEFSLREPIARPRARRLNGKYSKYDPPHGKPAFPVWVYRQNPKLRLNEDAEYSHRERKQLFEIFRERFLMALAQGKRDRTDAIADQIKSSLHEDILKTLSPEMPRHTSMKQVDIAHIRTQLIFMETLAARYGLTFTVNSQELLRSTEPDIEIPIANGSKEPVGKVVIWRKFRNVATAEKRADLEAKIGELAGTLDDNNYHYEWMRKSDRSSLGKLKRKLKSLERTPKVPQRNVNVLAFGVESEQSRGVFRSFNEAQDLFNVLHNADLLFQMIESAYKIHGLDALKKRFPAAMAIIDPIYSDKMHKHRGTRLKKRIIQHATECFDCMMFIAKKSRQ